MPRVKGQDGCRICDLFCGSLSLVSWHLSVREIVARSLEEWLMIRCSDMRCTVSCIASQALLVVARLAEDGLCPRCKEAPENLMHRLWSCRANEQYRIQLNSLVPAAVSFPDSLPHTLARTRIPPAAWDVLSLKGFQCLLNYLWCCAADGTTALAREYRELPEAPPFAFDRVQAERSMITPFLVPGRDAAKHLVLLSLSTLSVATCMWTAAVSLLSKTLLKSVVGACTLSKGNFVAPFSVVCCVRTLVSSNCRKTSRSWLHLFKLWSLSFLSLQVSAA